MTHDLEDLIERRLATLDTDAFRNEVAREMATEGGKALVVSEGEQLRLAPVIPVPLRLEAYLASALSGLSAEARTEIFGISDVVAAVCRAQGFELYEPRHATDPVDHPRISPHQVFEIDRDRVLHSDLLIHLAHAPSTGAGEELDFAYNALLPIVLISPNGRPISRMITGMPGLIAQIEYVTPGDLVSQLDEVLHQIKPLVEQRKLAFSAYDQNLVGDRVRILREDQGITRSELASAVGMSVATLKHLEESSDRLSNPSLVQLRHVAAALNTTVADLVEPDLGERLLGYLADWMSNAARGQTSAISRHDADRLLKRFLRRLSDSLGND